MAQKTKKDSKTTKGPSFGFARLTDKRRAFFLAAIVVAVAVGAFSLYVALYAQSVLPRIRVAGVAVSGKSLPQTATALEEQVESVVATTMTLKTEDKSKDIHAADIGLVIDAKATAANAYAYGRRDSFVASVGEAFMQIFRPLDVPFVITYDTEKLDKIVREYASEVDQPEVNAGVKVEGGKVVETAAAVGYRIDQAAAKDEVLTRWQMGTVGEVHANKHEVKPAVESGNTSDAIKQAEVLRTAKVILTAEGKDFTPSQGTYDSWISAELREGKLQASVKHETVKQWVEKIAPGVNQDVQEARLVMKDGRVTVFEQGKEGRSVDSDKTSTKILEAVRTYVQEGKKDKTIPVGAEILVKKPTVTDSNISTLGINELIGTATTSFTGSPENRKHNISVGAKTLNGILIKSGEEFSTLRYLGKIDGAAGYLPELVIKVNKTEPEFGGGLCQVSTTLFRSAMNSGLKITERRNHRYRVSYYEPPIGMDATIYEGSPDFKFVNDTPAYILIQSKVEGTKITFDIYGTKDGRRAERTEPVVFNQIDPGEPEYVQTDTLPEGTTKQTEKPHPGASASFNYTVYNADGSVRNKQTFTSKYVPWKARFLVGTKKVDPPPAETPPPAP